MSKCGEKGQTSKSSPGFHSGHAAAFQKKQAKEIGKQKRYEIKQI